MSFRDSLAKARTRIAFIVALALSFPLVLYLDDTARSLGGTTRKAVEFTDQLTSSEEQLPLVPARTLRDDQLEWARIAWRYFRNNIDPQSGMANSTNGYRSTTMWDTGSFLLAAISAERIGVLDRKDFDEIMTRALSSLAALPLFDGKLPNKAYNTRSLSMVDYNNKATDRGIGWSALDIARVLVPLTILKRQYPEHAQAVEKIIGRWSIKSMLRDGKLYGAVLDAEGNIAISQEGRIGYEEYAAKALIAAGYDAFEAWRTDDNIEYHDVDGVMVPSDDRAASTHGAQVYSTSEPYVMDGLEFGFDARSRALSEQLYLAQEARYQNTGILTAVSEGHVNKKPSFVYSTVFGNGRPWAVLTDKGELRNDLRFLTTKTAFGYDALYGTPYTRKMLEFVVALNDPKGGWLEGYYESTKAVNDIETANTNALILESIAYRSSGPLLAPGP